MDYEVVTLAEKKVVGISTRTNNFAPDMGKKLASFGNSFMMKIFILRFRTKQMLKH